MSKRFLKLILLNSFLAASLMGVAGKVFSSDFYIFPIREIEGLNFNKKSAESRPLIDKKAIDIFDQNAQRQIISSFISSLATAYPNSIVHERQVRDAIKGKYQYLSNGTTCGDGFVAPVNKSYAVVAGITRASFYEVDRGENIEILVPITMNIQLVKPEKAKIVYTASSTQYTPFVLSKREFNTPAFKDLMTKTLTSNTIKQINELIALAKKNFNPQESLVKVVAKSGGNIIVDKGFEIGFKLGDEPEARPKAASNDAIFLFKVLSTSSGYSILKPMSGNPSVGDELLFTFEGPADDSSKPKLMPVYSLENNQQWTYSVADLFAKDIGFKASFQISPVDINFNDTMNSIRAQANCVPWDKFPSSKTLFDSRLDHPNYFLKFEMSQSPVFINPGKAKVEENFMTSLTAQVVDIDGNVIFSELGTDLYTLERVGKQGLSLPNAKEISMKNALVEMMKSFLSDAKLTPKQFPIASAEKGKFTVKGLEIPGGQKVAYEVLRPLDIKVGNNSVVMRILVDQSNNPPVSGGGETTFSYSQVPDYPEIKSGDLISVLSVPRGNVPEISYCGDVAVGKDSLNGEYLLPIINHVAYKSKKYSASISQDKFYQDTNRLLKDGFFKFRLTKPVQTEECFKPGYLIRKNEVNCASNTCALKFLTGAKVGTFKGGAEIGGATYGEAISVDSIPQSEVDNYIAYKSMTTVNGFRNELLKRLDAK